MFWKIKLHCLIFFVCFSISQCDSSGQDLLNIRVLYIEGKINGESYQNVKDVNPRDIYFNNGAQIEYTCSYKIEPTNGSFEIHWIQQKGPLGNETILYGEYTSKKISKIKMTAYTFDDDSKISCILYNKNKDKTTLLYKTEIKMHLKDSSEVIHPSTNVEISDIKQFKMDCSRDSREYAAPSNNSYIVINKFELNKLNYNDYDGMILYCVRANVKREEEYLLTERIINNITILHYKGNSRSILSGALSTSGGVSFTIIIVIVVIVKGVLLLCSVLFYYKKRKRTDDLQNLDVGQQHEPANDTLPRVIFEKQQKIVQDRKSNTPIEELPHAEIVGITAPTQSAQDRMTEIGSCSQDLTLEK